MGGPQLAGGASLAGVRAGDVPDHAVELADQVALDQADGHQGDHEHPDQQGEIGLDRHPHTQLPARTDFSRYRVPAEGVEGRGWGAAGVAEDWLVRRDGRGRWGGRGWFGG